jgi:hypothetical protein
MVRALQPPVGRAYFPRYNYLRARRTGFSGRVGASPVQLGSGPSLCHQSVR